jgi:membrane protein
MQHKNVKRLVKIAPLYSIIKACRKIVLPGFEGLSLYLVARFFFHGLRNGTLNMRASSLAFSFFLALFPSIIFLFTLIPYLPIPHFQDSGLLSIGFFSALYFSTNGFNAMINSFNETFHEIEARRPLQQRLVSFYMLFVTVLLLATSISLLIGTELTFKHLAHEHKLLYYLVSILKWIVTGGLCYAIISFNYYVGPKRKKSWHFFSAGSMFATILIIAATIAFTYYVNNFGKYNKLYGSIGTLIVIMMLIYINSLILLLGFDLNASIHSAKKHRELYKRK